MTKLKVLKNFHDMQNDNIMRQVDTEFEASNERALELARLGLVQVLEIDKPRARIKPRKVAKKTSK